MQQVIDAEQKSINDANRLAIDAAIIKQLKEDQAMIVTIITKEYFKECVGVDPQDDDLDRCNCPQAGQLGHWQCGWDEEHKLPKFMLPFVGAPEVKEIILSETGVFEHIDNILNTKFTVTRCDADALIPNFGILPILNMGQVSIVFQKGITGNLLENLLNALPDLNEWSMCQETYYTILGRIKEKLYSYVKCGKLFRDFDKTSWIFEED